MIEAAFAAFCVCGLVLSAIHLVVCLCGEV